MAVRRTVSRAEVEPARSFEVEEWLELLSGGKKELLEQWIAWALAVEEGPTCAAGLLGHGGSGKSYFVGELSRCFDHSIVDIRPLVEGKTYFNAVLDRSVVLNVDENITPNTGHDAAATLRSLVSHTPTRIERKGVDAEEVSRIPYRVLITANSDAIMRALLMKAKSTYAERAATAKRVRIFRPGKEATEFMQSRISERWEETDAVRRHFFWLYEQRARWSKGERFLAEGTYDAALDKLCWFENEGNYRILRAIFDAAWEHRGVLRSSTARALAFNAGVHYTIDGHLLLDADSILARIEEGKARVTASHVNTVLQDLSIDTPQEAASARLRFFFHPEGALDMAEAPLPPSQSKRYAVSLERMIDMARMLGNEALVDLWTTNLATIQEL